MIFAEFDYELINKHTFPNNKHLTQISESGRGKPC
jgi:hypothetical protein